MEIILIIRKNYPIFVTPIKVRDLKWGLCSVKFQRHVELLNDPEREVYVKCDKNGGIDWRLRRGDRYEYRLFDISKHERTEHKLVVKTE